MLHSFFNVQEEAVWAFSSTAFYSKLDMLLNMFETQAYCKYAHILYT